MENKCENCIHYSVCEFKRSIDDTLCGHYKDKSLCVELPCKVGDTIYWIDLFNYEPCKKSGKDGDVCPHLYAECGFGYECTKTRFGEKQIGCATIETITIEDFAEILHYWKDFGKTVFLTKEEAERKLKEMENGK